MPLRHHLTRLSASGASWLRSVLAYQKSGTPSVTSRTSKLTRIDDVLARVGREPYAPD